MIVVVTVAMCLVGLILVCMSAAGDQFLIEGPKAFAPALIGGVLLFFAGYLAKGLLHA